MGKKTGVFACAATERGTVAVIREETGVYRLETRTPNSLGGHDVCGSVYFSKRQLVKDLLATRLHYHRHLLYQFARSSITKYIGKPEYKKDKKKCAELLETRDGYIIGVYEVADPITLVRVQGNPEREAIIMANDGTVIREWLLTAGNNHIEIYTSISELLEVLQHKTTELDKLVYAKLTEKRGK